MGEPGRSGPGLEASYSPLEQCKKYWKAVERGCSFSLFVINCSCFHFFEWDSSSSDYYFCFDIIAITLPSHAKMVDFADNLFSNDISSATYITYSSDQDLVGFQLNGVNEKQWLDGLPGM